MLSLYLLDASSGYAVRDVEGLDPVDASLTTSTVAQVDGAQPQNASRGTRNITIKLGLEPDFVTSTVDSLRSALYDWFMSKTIVAMTFYKDSVIFATSTGQVESMQNSMFSDDPEVDISIINYDPDFYAPASVTLDGNTTDATDTNTISYPGTSEAGVIFVLNINRTMTDFTVYNTTPDNTIQSTIISGSFLAGDIVTINSVPGSKAVTLTRASIDSSILYWRGTSSSWVTLTKGDNLFRVLSSGAAIPYTVTYTPKYGGL